MNTVWLRSLIRRYGNFGLIFVAVYLATYTLWKRAASPLYAAARQGVALLMVIVIGANGVLFLLGPRQPVPESDFIAAIRQERFHDAMKMLEDGADPNDAYIDRSNAPCVISRTTALELAVMADQAPLVEDLFRHGVRPTADTEVSLLTIASMLEKDTMFKILLAHGLHLDAADSENSGSALMSIANDAHALRGATRLLDAGADVNRLDANGRTVLMFASLDGNLPLVRLFLARGADSNRKAEQGETALSWAKEYKYSQIVTLLKQHGARE